MKQSIILKQKKKYLRTETEETYKSLRNEVVEVYKGNNGEYELGEMINLKQSYIFNSIDDVHNDVISSIHPTEDKVFVDINYEMTEVPLSELTTEMIICLIEELEDMIKNPSSIEIE